MVTCPIELAIGRGTVREEAFVGCALPRWLFGSQVGWR